MQKIKYFYLLFIFLIFSPNLIYAQKTIKSASEYDYPPFSIVTEKGEADGFSVELLRASLKAVGLDVEFYVGPWAKIKQDLAQGKIQVLPLVGRTPEREKIYDFSVPYQTNYGGIFVRIDETSIKTLKDLADKEVIVMKGDNAQEFLLRENVSKHIITTESFEDAFKMLSEGKHDAVVAQRMVGTQLIEKLGITNVISISRIDKYKQDWTFAVKEGDKELLASLNDGLSKIIINGTFDRIHDKWFGLSDSKIEIEKKESLPIIRMVWVSGILIFVVLFLLILNKLKIIKFEKNVIILLLAMALLLIIGLFIFNAYHITKNLQKSAIENYYDTLKATASVKYVNIEQHITHIKSALKIISSRKTISNEDLKEIVKLGEDFFEIFIIDSNGKITHSSDISHIGISRLTDPCFKNAKEGICIQPLYFSGTIGEVSFTLSTPYNKGVLVAIMNLNHIHEIISNKEGLGQSGESLLAYRNENGDAVFFTERKFTSEAESRDIIPKEEVNIPIIQALLRNEKEFSGYVDYRGMPVFAVTKYIDEIDAGLVVKIDQEEALKSVSGNINQIWYSATVIILAIIIIGIIFYFLLTYSLRREIKNKTNEFEKISKRLSEEVVLLENSERKLLSAFQLNKNIISLSPVGILIYNAAGDCITANDTAVELAGGTKAQILQQNYHQIDSWKKSGLYDIALSSMQGKTKKRQEIKIKTTFEKDCILDFQLVPFSMENQPHLLIMFDDVTDRKQAEEKITRFGRIFEDSLNEIYLFELDTLKFVQVNLAAMHNLGYAMEELEKLTPLDIKPEISAESFAKLTAPLIKEETQRVIFETVHKRKNQSLYNVEVHLQLLKHEHKSLFVAFILDITDRKRAQEEKVQLEEQYRQAQKMESIGRLAGGVAHDFNNSLSVIMGFTEFAMEDADPKGHQHEDLTEVLKASKRAADVARQLLAFARKQIISPEILDLNETVESMLKMLRRLIGEDIDLAWLPGANLWSVKMDPSQIDQILVNLCVNSRDAIEDVGKITIETNTVIFDSAYCAEHVGFSPGEFVLLALSDNGCGMDKKILDSIFEPFFTTKDVDKGTGLGLATVYGIVKQNNGFINVYSEPGKGTTIKIYLSRHKDQKGEIQRESTTEISIGRGETILLVEDDLSILKLVEKILKGLGYTVLTACTPVEGIAQAKENSQKIHLLLTDVIMPEMNGRELSERLQSQYPNLKCIFMSGYTANAIAHHGVLDEGMDFIQKPFSRTDLAKIVRKVLDEN
ncbi:transporter substrate-binding domain-containing protein [Desulfobacula sp.]